MSSEPKDYPYTYEAEQNAKGYFQIRVKIKSDQPLKHENVTGIVGMYIIAIKAAVENVGYHVQPEEELKKKIKIKTEPESCEYPYCLMEKGHEGVHTLADHGAEDGPGKIGE